MRTPEKNQHQEDDALQAPPGLVSALNRLPREPSFIPPMVDEAVLRAARRHFSKPDHGRVNWTRFMPWVVATAAIMLLLVAIPRLFHKPAAASAPDAALARRDLNQDGRADILDAFALARQLRSGAKPSPQLDVNGDGVVDERDVTALAARAVKLEKGGRS